MTRFALSLGGRNRTKATVHRLRKPSELGIVLASLWPRRVPQPLRRLSLTEILAEIDVPPEPGGLVCGYQVKVGTERHSYWLHRSGDHYEVTDTRPCEPPFVTEPEARLARTWFIQAMPDVATLCEPVYSSKAVLAV